MLTKPNDGYFRLELDQMTRARTIALTLSLVAVLCGSTAGLASAALPEFRAPGGFPVKFKGSSGAFELEDPDVHCASSTSEGELASAKTEKKVVVRFKGCKVMYFVLGFPCQSIGAKAEEVVTPILQGKVVYIKETVPKEAGVVFQSEAGTTLARLECTITEGLEKKTEKIFVDGSVIAKVPATNAKGEEQYNREVSVLAESFAQKEGKQVPAEYLEEGFKIKAAPTCELRLGEVESNTSCGLELANSLEMAAKVELKA
jgi:hypothetical protein